MSIITWIVQAMYTPLDLFMVFPIILYILEVDYFLNPPRFPLIIVFGYLYMLASIWESYVTEIVPEPYLDEVFHIPQAQAYCSGKYNSWDPKITTPPGLYLLALLKAFISQTLFGTSCSVHVLRSFNCIALLIAFICAYSCRLRITRTWKESLHTALNIALFPLLFFFSGLFYTDVLSTCSVLIVYKIVLDRKNTPKNICSSLSVFVFGIISVSIRQTNIFWVSIFAGALELVDILRLENFHMKRSYSWNRLHDVPVTEASPQDFVLCALSIVGATVNRPILLLQKLRPYLALLLTFGVFVIWNGGVVLGDKENHVATLHLSQMLYIWVFVSFFSIPLLVPVGIKFLWEVKSFLSNKSKYHILGKSIRTTAYLMGALSTILVVINYSTIVHPFTLADNRHYIFYVFRYTILRFPAIRFMFAPIYLICCWIVYLTLCASNPEIKDLKGVVPDHVSSSDIQKTSICYKQSGPSISSVLILLITSTLSLITSPLVEPRYFIIPWIIWRLNLPPVYSEAPALYDKMIAKTSTEVETSGRKVFRAFKSPNHTLLLETLWFLLINLCTGYIFLYKGFEWPQEPGRIQRFMW